MLAISIDALPDDALLEIFHHCIYGVNNVLGGQRVEKAWQSLVHVCHRWRSIVFESPRRLDLWLVCTGRTPARDRLDVWPTLPLIIQVPLGGRIRRMDNIIAAVERSDRVCKINLEYVSSSVIEMILAEMQQPFPELTFLRLLPNSEMAVVPDLFLGGSAPRLQHLELSRIPFPSLPKLLLSATHLRHLQLRSIPHSGYFSPDAIATVFPTLTSLNFFDLEFISTRSCPDRESRRPPPSTRSVLPVLTSLRFKGVSEYLEDLVAHINAPPTQKFAYNLIP